MFVADPSDRMYGSPAVDATEARLLVIVPATLATRNVVFPAALVNRAPVSLNSRICLSLAVPTSERIVRPTSPSSKYQLISWPLARAIASPVPVEPSVPVIESLLKQIPVSNRAWLLTKTRPAVASLGAVSSPPDATQRAGVMPAKDAEYGLRVTVVPSSTASTSIHVVNSALAERVLSIYRPQLAC